MHLQIMRSIDSGTCIYCTRTHSGGTNLTCNDTLQPLCPGTVVTCRCEVPSSTAVSQVAVVNTLTQLCHGNVIRLPQAPPCAGRDVPSSSGRCGPIEAHNEENGIAGYCTVMVVTMRVEQTLEGAGVTCTDMGTMLLIGSVPLHVVSKFNVDAIIIN